MRKFILKFNMDGGLNITSNYELPMEVNKLTVGKNIELGYDGCVKKRKGYEVLGTAGAYTPLGLAELLTTAGVYIPVCATNQGKLFRMDSLDGTWDDISHTAYTTTATARWHFAQAEGTLIGADGTNLIQYNGTGNAAALDQGSNSPPAGARFPLYMWGYTWLANATSNKSMLYYSKYRDVDYYDTASWILPIDVNDGGDIEGLAKGEKCIHIWKTNCMGSLYWTNTNTDSPTFRWQRRFDVGLASQKSVQRTPFGFVFVDQDLNVRLWDEQNYPTIISDDIREDLQNVIFSRGGQLASCWLPALNQYIVSIPYGTGATTNNRIYVCTFSKAGYKWAWYDWAVNDFRLLHNSGQPIPYFVESGATGYCYRALYTELDNASAIRSQAKSKWLSPRDFNVTEEELQLEYIKLTVAAEGNWDMRFGYELNFEQAGRMYTVNQFAGGDLIGSTFIIGSSKIGGGNSDVFAKRYFRGVNFHHIRFVAENNYASQPFTVKSIEIGVKTKGEK